jgi:hypothetical protein
MRRLPHPQFKVDGETMNDPTKILVHDERAGSGEVPMELFTGFQEVELRELEGFIAQTPGEILVAVWGGDGTCRSVASLAVDQSVTVLPCPGGTHNHFAKAAGFTSLETVARSLLHPTSKLVDVGLVNDEVFLNNLSIGWYVDLVTRRERYEKRMHRRLAKITSVLAQLFFMRRLRITVDGERERVWLVWVGNGAFSTTPLALPERESLETKALDIRLLRASGTATRHIVRNRVCDENGARYPRRRAHRTVRSVAYWHGSIIANTEFRLNLEILGSRFGQEADGVCQTRSVGKPASQTKKHSPKRLRLASLGKAQDMTNQNENPEHTDKGEAPDTALAHLNKPANQPTTKGPTEDELLEQTGNTALSKLNKPSSAPTS